MNDEDKFREMKERVKELEELTERLRDENYKLLGRVGKLSTALREIKAFVGMLKEI